MNIYQLKGFIRKGFQPLCGFLAKIGVDPNYLTVLGFGMAVLSGFAFSMSEYFYACTFLILSGIFDIIDGGVARAGGYVSDKGALLDSVLDRVGELAVYIGLVVGLTNSVDKFVVLVLLGAAFSVSYIRARSEGLGITIEGVGIMERSERVLAIGLGALLAAIFGEFWLTVVLYAVATLTIITMFHRLIRAYSKLANHQAKHELSH